MGNCTCSQDSTNTRLTSINLNEVANQKSRNIIHSSKIEVTHYLFYNTKSINFHKLFASRQQLGIRNSNNFMIIPHSFKMPNLLMQIIFEIYDFQIFKINESGTVCKEKEQLIFKSEINSTSTIESREELLTISKIDKGYYIVPSQIQNDQNDCVSDTQKDSVDEFTYSSQVQKHDKNDREDIVNLSNEVKKQWLVVRSIQKPEKGMTITQGDVLKFGKTQLKISEVQLQKQETQEDENNQKKNLSSNQCRICLSSKYTNQNPLINPCNCSGTMQYVHLFCLQNWILSKNSHLMEQQMLAFYWDDMKCELCHGQFQRFTKTDNGDVADLIEMSKPKNSKYLIFETVDSTQTSYLVNFNEKDEILIGRSLAATFKLNDQSISRYHAKIRIQNDELYIYDNDSKFGTLVQLKQSLPILKEFNQLQIQIDNVLLEIQTSLQVQAMIQQGIQEINYLFRFCNVGYYKLM